MKYKKYMGSGLWQEKKRELARYEKGVECWICGEKKVETHHLNYKSISHEDVEEDLRFLCRAHHQLVHDLVEKEKISIHKATYLVRKLWTKENGYRWGNREVAEYWGKCERYERRIGRK